MSWLEEMLARQSRIAGGDGQTERLRQQLRQAAAVLTGGTAQEPARSAAPVRQKKARSLLSRLAAWARQAGGAAAWSASEKKNGMEMEAAKAGARPAEQNEAQPETPAEERTAEEILQSLPRQAAGEPELPQTQAALAQMQRRLSRAAWAPAPVPRAQTLAADGPQSMSLCGPADAAALSRLYERDARRYDGGFEFPL